MSGYVSENENRVGLLSELLMQSNLRMAKKNIGEVLMWYRICS